MLGDNAVKKNDIIRVGLEGVCVCIDFNVK